MNDDGAFQRIRDMGSSIGELRENKPRTFRVLVWSVCLFLLGLMALPYLLYQAFRSKHWNTRAYAVKAARAETVDANIVFTVDLENTTADDLTLAPTFRFMVAAKENDAVQHSAVKFNDTYFIPSHHVGRVWLTLTDACTDKQDARACYAENFGDDRNIVFFDEENRIEGRIPLPTTVPAGTIHVPAPEVAPDANVPSDPKTP